MFEKMAKKIKEVLTVETESIPEEIREVVSEGETRDADFYKRHTGAREDVIYE